METADSPRHTVIVLGASGRFGGAAARAFAQAGWRVVAQTRRPVATQNTAPGEAQVHWVQADAHDTAALAREAGSAQVVVHALNPAYTNAAWEREAPALTAAALALAQALGATLMLPGNIYNFGAHAPQQLREETPFWPHTRKGRVRVALEAQLQASAVRTVVIRAGDFFGSGQGSWLDMVLAKDLRKGVLCYPGAAGVRTAWAYLPDLAQCFVQVAQRRAQLATHEVLHFAGHGLERADWERVLTAWARAQGWLAPQAALRQRSMPWAFLRLLAWVHPLVASMVEMRYLWQEPHTLDNRRLVALLGSEPHTPFDQAARAALQALQPPARAATGKGAVVSAHPEAA
ncbi:MAG: sugar nucleotide-binding protein [Rhodoferax sp.]